MANAERAIEKLYEDAALRDSLADAEAQMLLRWGEDQIMRLAEEAPDDATFDTQLDQLRTLLKGANRFVGERGQMDAETRASRLGALMAQGEALGAPLTAEASALADSFTTGDDATTLQALLGLLTPVTASASLPAPITPAPTRESATVTPAPETPANAPETPAPAAEEESAANRPATPSILQAFQKWLKPTSTETDPPQPDRPSTGPTFPLPAPKPTDDDTTGDTFLHGETQDHTLD